MPHTSNNQIPTKNSVMEAINKREARNKGKLVGLKPPLKPKDIWAIRIHLQNRHAVRDLAMFNLAIDSKLRSCDLVSLRDTFDATYEGNTDLQANEEPESGSVIARTHQAGEHGEVPGY